MLIGVIVHAVNLLFSHRGESSCLDKSRNERKPVRDLVIVFFFLAVGMWRSLEEEVVLKFRSVNNR